MKKKKPTKRLMITALSLDSFPVIAIIGNINRHSSKAMKMTAKQLHPLKAIRKSIRLKNSHFSCNFFFLKLVKCFLALETSLSLHLTMKECGTPPPQLGGW